METTLVLSELLNDLRDAIVKGDPTIEINKVEVDSRKVTANDLFVAIPGEKDDGLKYVPDAINKGAVAVVAPEVVEGKVRCAVKVSDIRQAAAKIAARFYDHPSRKLHLVGITGTNGKTTTTWLLRSIFDQTGYPTGVIGTLGNFTPKQVIDSPNTTPGALEFERTLDTMVKESVRYVAAEISSHGLSMNRVDELEFKAVAITNITQDHFDFHKTFENYREAKAHILDLVQGPSKWAVLNRDDASFDFLRKRVKSSLLTFSINDPAADVRLEKVQMSVDGSKFRLVTPQGSIDVHLHLLGKFNLENALCASAVALASGIDLEKIAKGLSERTTVNGRAENVAMGQPFTVLVDYAHSPDALSNILDTARQLCKGKLMILFGCGGDRDKLKRPLMGKVSSEKADIVIVTSDNPRSEDPLKIIEDIKPGLDFRKQILIEPDRRTAIRLGVNLCKENDVLIIAGKGHEQFQLIGSQRFHFGDRETVEEILKERLK